ncbi:dihydrodipicolinate synthase family protein, partial [Rhizobium ruizarguesonis]
MLDATDVNLILYNYPTKDGIEISFDLMDALADDRRVIG